LKPLLYFGESLSIQWMREGFGSPAEARDARRITIPLNFESSSHRKFSRSCLTIEDIDINIS